MEVVTDTMSLTDYELDLVRENVDELSDMSDKKIRDLQESSWLTSRQFLAYVLSEAENGMTHAKIAEEMDYDDPGTVSNYKSRVGTKLSKSEKSLEIKEFFGGDDA